jgi:hypothetical protein
MIFRRLTLLLIAMSLIEPALAEPFTVVGVKLEVTAIPEKPEIMLGEPTWVLFKVANQSDRDLLVMIGGDTRNRLGRPDTFKVSMVSADGKNVPQPEAGPGFGGAYGPRKLPAKGEFVFALFVPHWATFEQPGRYTMTIRRKLELAPDDGTDAFPRKTDHVEVSTSTTITVVPADSASFGELIQQLGDTMLAKHPPIRNVGRLPISGRSTQQFPTPGRSFPRDDAAKMLHEINDVRVIPRFIELLQERNTNDKQVASRALGKFNNDEAFAALEQAMKTTGADIEITSNPALADECAESVHESAIHAIAFSPHPKAIPFLWTRAGDRNHRIRLLVLRRAAELKTPETRAIIQVMLNDEHEAVRDNAARYWKALTEAEK